MDLLCYMWQQVQQFRRFGEDFAMEHDEWEYWGKVEADLRNAILKAIPPEERLRGLSAEDRLRGLSPEERLRGLPPEEMFRGLSEDQAARLYELLERRRGS
jgi:hypothetical protein